MKCANCGKIITYANLPVFNRDGSDSLQSALLEECPENAVFMDVDPNWTGYELTEEEQMERIQCPHCGNFPFAHREVQVYEVVRIVCFKK